MYKLRFCVVVGRALAMSLLLIMPAVASVYSVPPIYNVQGVCSNLPIHIGFGSTSGFGFRNPPLLVSMPPKPNNFAYLYGSAGTARYDMSPQMMAHYGATADDSDVVIAAGFGMRLGAAWRLELGVIDIGTPYKQKRYWPQPEGNMATQQGQVLAHEISAQYQWGQGGKGGRSAAKNLRQPRLTARLGWAELDSETGDHSAPFVGVGAQYAPLRAEYRYYDFDGFEAGIFLFSYIYDF